MNSTEYIKTLNLIPHPEGGYYRETYRSSIQLSSNSGIEGLEDRNLSTGIYFLLEQHNFSAFHRIRSDEMWHFYAGDPLEVIELTEQSGVLITRLGPMASGGQGYQHVVPANRWFASRVAKGGNFSLCGCTVAPGFDFRDFEMANRQGLLEAFPDARDLIMALTRT